MLKLFVPLNFSTSNFAFEAVVFAADEGLDYESFDTFSTITQLHLIKRPPNSQSTLVTM